MFPIKKRRMVSFPPSTDGSKTDDLHRYWENGTLRDHRKELVAWLEEWPPKVPERSHWHIAGLCLKLYSFFEGRVSKNQLSSVPKAIVENRWIDAIIGSDMVLVRGGLSKIVRFLYHVPHENITKQIQNGEYR